MWISKVIARMNKVSYLIILLLSLFCSGCEFTKEENNKQKGTVSPADINKQVEQLSGKFRDLVNNPETSVDEFKKLSQIEYEVFSVPASENKLFIARYLTDKGQQRWDCYHVEKEKEGETINYVFFCKRPVGTPLRYLPRSFLGN